MSFQTWKNEFYAVEVEDLDIDNMFEEDVIQHSLTKWMGALQENIKKHNVDYYNYSIYDLTKMLKYDSTSCSLCYRYRKNLDDCIQCPIFRYTGFSCCLEDINVGDDRTPRAWELSSNNPEPMINLLKKVLALSLEHQRLRKIVNKKVEDFDETFDF